MRRELRWVLFLGIGIGMILTTSIHILKQDTKIIITEEYIRQEAQKLGLVDPNELFDKSNSLEQENNTLEIENNNQTNHLTSDPNKNNNLTLENEESINKINLIIPSGSTSKSVARILKKNQLIKSEWKFRNKLRVRKLDKYIRSGAYEIDQNTSEEEIINIITSGNRKLLLE